jgi:hypothetical protein
MIRNLMAMTALAATAFAVPALAETSVHVTLSGKSQAERYAAIAGAARTVCADPYAGEAHEIYSADACVQDTIAAAMMKAKLSAPTAPLAATSVRVNLVGKSPAEAYAAIKLAAASVCSVRVPGVSYDTYSNEACVSATTAAAVAQSPILAKFAETAGFDKLASN